MEVVITRWLTKVLITEGKEGNYSIGRDNKTDCGTGDCRSVLEAC